MLTWNKHKNKSLMIGVEVSAQSDIFKCFILLINIRKTQHLKSYTRQSLVFVPETVSA